MEFYPDEAARTRVRRATTVRCTVETVCIFKKHTLILVKIHAVARSSGVSIFGCYQEPGTEGKVSGFVCSNYENCNSTANVFAWTNVSIVLRSSQLKAIEPAADQPTSTSASVSSAFLTTSTPTSSTARSVGYTTSQMAGVDAGIGIPLFAAFVAVSVLFILERKRSRKSSPIVERLASVQVC